MKHYIILYKAGGVDFAYFTHLGVPHMNRLSYKDAVVNVYNTKEAVKESYEYILGWLKNESDGSPYWSVLKEQFRKGRVIITTLNSKRCPITVNVKGLRFQDKGVALRQKFELKKI